MKEREINEPNWLGVVSEAFGSQEVQLAFSQALQEERNLFIDDLKKSIGRFQRVHSRLCREEIMSENRSLAKRLGLDRFTYYELNNRPHAVVKNLFRRGKYLDFSSLDDETLVLYPRAVQVTIDAYQEHIDQFADQSIAHLCPTRRDLSDLSSGFYLLNNPYGPIEMEAVKVDTIEELRVFLERFAKEPRLKAYRKLLNRGSFTKAYDVFPRRKLQELQETFEQWVTMPPESQLTGTQ